jgi:hypothetical protein
MAELAGNQPKTMEQAYNKYHVIGFQFRITIIVVPEMSWTPLKT